MNKSKYTTITDKNIHLIMFRIKQFISRMQIISMQNFYLDTIQHNKQFGEKGIEKSQTSYLDANEYKIETDFMHGRRFIKVNYQAGNSAFLLEVGNKIRITPSNIYVSAPFVTDFKRNRKFPLEIWSKGNLELCARQTEDNIHYSNAY